MKLIGILFLVLVIGKEGVQAEHPIRYALSPVYLQYLEDVESRMYHYLKQSSEDGSPAKEILQSYLSDYEDNVPSSYVKAYSANVDSAPYKISNNPILALQMISRFVKYFKIDAFKSVVKKLIDEDKLPTETEESDSLGALKIITGFFEYFKIDAFKTDVGNLIEDDAIPTETEESDALEAILRIQHYYELDPHELADGYLDGVKTEASLSAGECYKLGNVAKEKRQFTLALQWYDATLRRLKADKEAAKSGLKEDLVMKALDDTINEHNELLKANNPARDIYSFSKPITSSNYKYSSFAHLALRKTLAEELMGKILEKGDPEYRQAIEVNMMAVCQGRDLQPAKVKAKLKCWLDTKRHPYWTIKPLKIEVKNENPPVIQIYDVFNDKWAQYLKNLSQYSLGRAPRFSDQNSATYTAFEDEHAPEAPISRVVELVTGLNVVGRAASAPLNVAAYAFGGHVNPHFDSLNDVERGGLTAFPWFGIGVEPVKNSALLWYPHLENGEIDKRMMHVACPIILGQKWISTKWTTYNENIFKRPCGLRPDE